MTEVEMFTNSQVRILETIARGLGARDERERIIKLLEDEELHTHSNNLMKDYDEIVWLGIKEQLIALIKGETNE